MSAPTIYLFVLSVSLLGALLILLAMLFHLIAPCPSSCMVCSEEVTLCQGLTYILGNQVRHFKENSYLFCTVSSPSPAVIVLTASYACCWEVNFRRASLSHFDWRMIALFHFSLPWGLIQTIPSPSEVIENLCYWEQSFHSAKRFKKNKIDHFNKFCPHFVQSSSCPLAEWAINCLLTPPRNLSALARLSDVALIQISIIKCIIILKECLFSSTPTSWC